MNLTATLSSLAMAVSTAGLAQQLSSTIERVEVLGSKQAQGLSTPADNTLAGVLGEGISVFDTPLSVTSLSAEMLQALNIATLHDIVKVAPNSYASGGFGTPSLPSIRGQLGELFQDGLRRQAGNNGFGLPLSFNSIDGIDVVKGPSSVIFGSTQRNGGFVNLHSKAAPLTENSGVATLRAGRWDQYSAQLDYGQVIDPGKQGIRVSVEWLDHGSFYDYASQHSENLYLSYRYAPSADTQWDISAEYYNADYPDIAGINRPTQNLIDKGLYITGQGLQADGSTVPAAGSIISPTGEVTIPRSSVYTHPDDINGAQTTLLRSRYQQRLSARYTLRNSTYYQHLNREEIATNSFVEIIDGADTFENRLELDINSSDQQRSTVGVALRYNDVLGYSQFTTEADNPVDLTAPLEYREIALSNEQKSHLIALRENLFVSPGGQYDLNGDGEGDFNLSDTTNSTSWQTGLFVQQHSQWTDAFTTIAGIRADYYAVTARDPIAPEGVKAASDSHHDTLISYQLGARYALTDNINIYVQLADNQATSNSMAGGTALGADNRINPLNFATENTLYEVGIKYVGGQRWYAEAALFEQSRSLRNRDGSNTGIQSQGFEIQAFYNTEDLWLNASYSYLDARYDDSPAYQDTAQVADAFDNSRPDIIAGTGIGSPSFAAFAPSTQQVQGIPEQLVAINMGWQVNTLLQLGASAWYSKSFPLDFLGTVKIRDQYTLDANADIHITDEVRVRVDIRNLTDQQNWQPVFEGGYFGATLVMPSLPRHAQFTVQYQF